MQIAFAIYPGLDGFTPSDLLAAHELERRGHTVTPLPWSTPASWGGFDAVVIRATWDYYTRPTEYLAWLNLLEAQGVTLWNPAPLARWNMNKRYLTDLERQGIPTVPTEWVARASEPPLLEQLLHARGWDDVVVKPAVSASANRTWRIAGEVQPDDQERFGDILRSGDVMVQPFLRSLATQGEWSLVFLGGEFSHAVLKRPADGDFRVQTHHGGTAGPARAPAGSLHHARSILEKIPWPWLYARVDGCMVDGEFTLVELEMLEPDLFFNLDSGAAGRFADSLLRLQKDCHELGAGS